MPRIRGSRNHVYSSERGWSHRKCRIGTTPYAAHPVNSTNRQRNRSEAADEWEESGSGGEEQQEWWLEELEMRDLTTPPSEEVEQWSSGGRICTITVSTKINTTDEM